MAPPAREWETLQMVEIAMPRLQTTCRRARLTLFALVVALAGGGPAAAQDQSMPGGFTADQVQGIELIIKRYLMENPEVLIESLNAFQQRERLAEEQRRQDAILAEADALKNDPSTPVLGNPEGDVAMVEFFDYRCPYCRRVADSVKDVVDEDGNVRLIMKEFPILGPESMRAARAALAAHRQGKYEPFHWALMTRPGDMSEAHLRSVAEEVGLDVAQMERDMQADAIDESLKRNFHLADALGINGTPAFVIGNTLVPGAIDVDTMRKLIAEARANGS